VTAQIGVALPLSGSTDELTSVAREVEQLGYEFLWANDDRLQRDVFSMLATFAACTERVRLGPGVTNPFSRHPALIASAVATLDDLSGGRAVLGLGAGGTNHRALGVERRKPATALREAVKLIRGLLAGKTVSVDGAVIKAQDAVLEFAPRRADLPVYLGARGPRILELAGELADGVIVGNVASRHGWEYALERVGAGAARAGRPVTELEAVAWLYCSLDDDGDAALDAVRPMVATSLATSRPVLDELGVDMPSRFADEMARRDWSLAHADVAAAGRLIPTDVITKFALAGTPATCRTQAEELLGAFPQISQLAIVPFANARQTVRDVVSRFSSEVVPDSTTPNVASPG